MRLPRTHLSLRSSLRPNLPHTDRLGLHSLLRLLGPLPFSTSKARELNPVSFPYDGDATYALTPPPATSIPAKYYPTRFDSESCHSVTRQIYDTLSVSRLTRRRVNNGARVPHDSIQFASFEHGRYPQLLAIFLLCNNKYTRFFLSKSLRYILRKN